MSVKKIAVPLAGGQFSSHFGGAEAFALYSVREDERTIADKEQLVPPPHEPGAFPKWLRSQGASTILAGGMGPRALNMFQAYGITVVLGVEGSAEPDEVVRRHLEGTLKATGQGCRGGGLHHCHGHGEA
jgi:predicted Fe-Mo cluster-binding NifX family protein